MSERLGHAVSLRLRCTYAPRTRRLDMGTAVRARRRFQPGAHRRVASPAALAQFLPYEFFDWGLKTQVTPATSSAG